MILWRVAGGIALAVGLALTGLTLYAVQLQLVKGFNVEPSFIALLALFVPISIFCTFTGYRLAFNRPNQYGSLLSPTGWNCVGAFFVLLSMGLALVGLSERNSVQQIVLAAFVGLVALAYGSFAAARAAKRRLSILFTPGTSLLQRKGFTPVGFRWGVEILNDDGTPMEFVVSALTNVVGLSEADATGTMLDIHRKGGVLLPTETFEEATRIAAAIASEADANGHPLVCRAVSVEAPAWKTTHR